jgi:hypothetical protein
MQENRQQSCYLLARGHRYFSCAFISPITRRTRFEDNTERAAQLARKIARDAKLFGNDLRGSDWGLEERRNREIYYVLRRVDIDS